MHIRLLTGAFVLLAWSGPSVAADPAITRPNAKKPAPFYTLQIEQGSNLTDLEKTADYIAQIVPLRVRIVKEGDGYVIRRGKFFQSDELEAHAVTLKSVGFSGAIILYIQTGKEQVAKISNPEAPESAEQPLDQPLLLRARQVELHDANRRSNEYSPAGAEISRILHPQQETQGETGSPIQRAWEAYRHGSLAIACGLFESAQIHPDTKQEALRGLAHCRLQTGKYEDAIALATELLKEGVQPDETRSILVEALFKAGKYESALKEARLMNEAQSRQWTALITATETAKKLSDVRKRYDPKHPELFLAEHLAELEQCLVSDIFLSAAQDLSAAKNKAAVPLFERLLDFCGGHWEIRLPAYIGLIQILPSETMRPRIDRELERKNLPPDYRRKLLNAKIDLLRRMVAGLRDEPAETLYREILALAPNDKAAQTFLAWQRFNHQDYSVAHDYFLALYRRYPHELDIVKGLAFTLARLGKIDAAIALAETTQDLKLQTDFLRDKLIKNPPESKETLELSQRILAKDPGDKTALSALAWWHYQHQEYRRSSELFRRLSRAAPDSSDYRTGLVYSLLKQNRLDEAFEEFRKVERQDDAYRKLEANLYMSRANRYFQDKEYQKAEEDLKKLLNHSPDDPDARLLLGWSLYFRKEKKAALDYFLGIWRERQSTELAPVLLSLFDELGKTEQKAAFIRQLAQSKAPELHKTLADYYAGQGWRIRAAEAFNDRQSPYFNAHRPSLALDFLYRNRSGDAGTSYFEQQGARLAYKYPLHEGRSVSFELTPEHLSAGSIKNFSTLSVGTVVGVGNKAMQRTLLSSADLVTPALKFQAEGEIKQSYLLGTTPLNGALAPTATATAQFEGRNWLVNFHQEPIMQSLLSYTGLNDPFGSGSWGRVVRSGANGRYTFPLSQDYWLSFAGRADYHWGKNVLGNFGAEGGVTGGKSITTDQGALTLGVFLTNIHFERNVNFYTFGHGGYFSPNYLFASGPFLNFEHKTGNKIWWKTELSANWFHAETSDAPFFPLQKAPVDEGYFAGSVKDGIGYRLALEGRYLLTPYLDIGGRFSLEQSAAFRDIASNVGIRMYFSPRNSLVEKGGF